MASSLLSCHACHDNGLMTRISQCKRDPQIFAGVDDEPIDILDFHLCHSYAHDHCNVASLIKFTICMHF